MRFEASMDMRIFFLSITCSMAGKYRRFRRYTANLLQGIILMSVCLDGTGHFEDLNFNEMIILKMMFWT
jgi:hypothetical protein